MPYVYFLKNKTTGLKYIGVKYSKGCDSKLFWLTYFTSSKQVKQLIKLFGKEDFSFKILKEFENRCSALDYENKLLKIATKKDDYLNMHTNFHGSLTHEQIEENHKKQAISASITGLLCLKNKTGIFSLSKKERIKACSNGGINAARVNRLLNRAIFNKEIRSIQHKTLKLKKISAFYNPDTRKEISRKGGLNGRFSKKYFEKNNMPEEQRIEEQRKRGKIGGKKNSGFIWYNDGLKSYKYTKKQQKELNFNDFLKENPSFKKGRTSANKKNN
jgi:hypothetical protein